MDFRYIPLPLAALALALLVGCHGAGDGLAILSVGEVAKLIKTDRSAVVCDANGASTREQYGTIPGAVLLASYADYDVETALPASKDTPLVFYCSSKMCSAAPRAAHKAIGAGYTDVFIMPEGIKGWLRAGQPVDAMPVG